MSAINIVCMPRQIQISTDGASYDHAGVVIGFGSKVSIQPQWPGAMVMRGSVQGGQIIYAALASRFRTFDDVVKGIENELRTIVMDHGLANLNLQLFIAGWSAARSAAEFYMIFGSDLPAAGNTERREPFKLLAPMRGFVVLPPVDGAGSPDPKASPLDVSRQLKAIIRSQRQQAYDGVHYIGGHAELVCITRDEITTQAFEVWPEDEIGKMIMPDQVRAGSPGGACPADQQRPS